MEQFHQPSPKPTLSRVRGPIQYNFKRMSTHTDKTSDKLMSTSANSRDVYGKRISTQVEDPRNNKKPNKFGNRPNPGNKYDRKQIHKQDVKASGRSDLICNENPLSKSNPKFDPKYEEYKAYNETNLKTHEEQDEKGGHTKDQGGDGSDVRSFNVQVPSSELKGKNHEKRCEVKPNQTEVKNGGHEKELQQRPAEYTKYEKEKCLLRDDITPNNTQLNDDSSLPIEQDKEHSIYLADPKDYIKTFHTCEHGADEFDELSVPAQNAENISQSPLENQLSVVSDALEIDMEPKDLSDEDIDNNLPSTAILLTTESGSKVYVVGTVHFSLESQRDVSKVIRAVQPDYLVLELCTSRAYMLQWNEEQLLKEAQNLNFEVITQVLRRAGFVQGGLYLLLLSMTIKITKQLGVAPGGEFRTAYKEAMGIPNCIVCFGDRPIQITLQRMLSSLSLWQIIKLTFVVLFSDEKISKEEVENCKNRDVLEGMLLGFSRELPEFARVMVSERDAYLAYSLHNAAQGSLPLKVVGVVGIGHLAGIQENWGRVSLSEMQEILSIPPPSKSSKIIKFTLKFTIVGLVLYGAHRLASKTNFYSNWFSDQNYRSLSNMVYETWDVSAGFP